MILAGRPAKILLIDTNVYFSKRLSDALKREGFEVACSTQPSFALTTLEYDSPSAIVCSTNMREMGALDIARMVRADAKNSALPIIAIGDGSQRALMEAFQAGCDDYVDRTRPPAVLATHIRNIIISKAEGFQPTQMLTQSDTSLSGSLTHHDLPGVMQMLGHAHQTGALHINSGDTDALLFFDAGAITHAECASLFGDEAVIQILKSCMKNNSGVYKFAYGSASPQRTVLRSATDLMLDAMREIDESAHAEDSPSVAGLSSLNATDELVEPPLSPATESSLSDDPVATFVDNPIAPDSEPSRESAATPEIPTAPFVEFGNELDFDAQTTEESDHAAITARIDDFAAASEAPFPGSSHSPDVFALDTGLEETPDQVLEAAAAEPAPEVFLPRATESESQPSHLYHSSEFVPSEPQNSAEQQPDALVSGEHEFPRHEAADEASVSDEPQASSQLSGENDEAQPIANPFANYSIVPYPGDDSEDNP